MNNNDSDKNGALQAGSEQLVWERLKNEAVAAQRWRLEQEMEQAGEYSVLTSGSGYGWTEALPWSNRLVVVAMVSFVIASFVVVVCCIVR